MGIERVFSAILKREVRRGFAASENKLTAADPLLSAAPLYRETIKIKGEDKSHRGGGLSLSIFSPENFLRNLTG